LVIGDFERAGDLLGRDAETKTGSREEGQRVREGIRDPSRRIETLRALAESTPDRPEWELALHRIQGNGPAAAATFERAVDGPHFESVYVAHALSLLGPELAAQPRVVSAIRRLEARLREHYGVSR
jgi:hypothetical protein